MRLRETDDPIAVWLHAERYLGGGTRSYSRFSDQADVSARCHPQWGADSFRLPTFRVPDRLGSYLRNRLPSRLHEWYRRDGWFLLPVHPDTLDHPDLHRRADLLACPPGPPVEVVPLANARTVLVRRIGDRPVEPHFLKLHYPRRLSRFTRRLRRPIIELQLWVATELARVGVPFLPEVGGAVFGTDPVESWGYLLREPRLTGRDGDRSPVPEFTVPLFALYGRDLRAAGDPTLLEQLVAHSGLDAASFLSERVVEPMVALWLRTAAATGCLTELHGQNTLLTFSGLGRHSQLGYRDCAVYVDPAIRSGLGRGGDLPPRNVISVDIQVPRAQVASLVYDTFLGNHALSYLARLATDRLGVPDGHLPAVARRAFGRLATGAVELPPTVFNYDDQLYPDGAWRLVDTGARPLWR